MAVRWWWLIICLIPLRWSFSCLVFVVVSFFVGVDCLDWRDWSVGDANRWSNWVNQMMTNQREFEFIYFLPICLACGDRIRPILPSAHSTILASAHTTSLSLRSGSLCVHNHTSHTIMVKCVLKTWNMFAKRAKLLALILKIFTVSQAICLSQT